MSAPHQTMPDDLLLIDTQHLERQHVIATYLLDGDAPALVDPGPTSTLATVEAALARQGRSLGDLRAILLTHIHLDHAGAAGTLVARYPHIQVYVHQRGAPHMADPERLIRSATRLYGEAMGTLWGEFRAVPAERLTVLAGGETIRLGRRTLRAFDAPGHASHHLIYLDETSGAAFVGDNGGIRLPMMDGATPATPPPDIDLEAWGRTLDLLRSLDPQLLLLTHFGPSFDAAAHIDGYRASLAHWAEAVRAGLESNQPEEAQVATLRAMADASLPPETTPADRLAYHQAAPIAQCWQGLARYWRKRAEGA